MKGESVELVDLVKRYDQVLALDRFSLRVEPGEFLTLLGPSGSGKSTVLKLIAGFEHPTSGRVLIGGRDVTLEPPYRRNVGMVFQNYALFPHLTVFENVAFPLRVRRVPQEEIRRRVRSALALVGLEGVEQRYPRQLSGGQQQRVALARALVYEPPVLLMDEPLGALDKQLRERMQLELKHLHRQVGVTVIFVTHDQEEALTMSDRVAVIRDGRLEQVGTPREIYERPRTRFVATFLGETNLFEGELVPAAGGAVLRTRGGLELRTADRGRPGRGVLAVRPEKVVLLPDREEPAAGAGAQAVPVGRDEFDVVEGLVEEVIFRGDSVRYRVQVGRGEAVVVKAPNRGDNHWLAPGQRVRLAWSIRDAVLVEERSETEEVQG